MSIVYLFLVSFADHLKRKQISKDLAQWDFEYIGHYKKAMAKTTDPDGITKFFHRIKHYEALRDFSIQSLRQINHLVQIDEMPNLDLKEARCEIYKISLSFRTHRKS